MEQKQDLYIFLADISGYTSYLIKSQSDYYHGTSIITEIMRTLIHNLELPLQVVKLEGDAIFLTAYKKDLNEQLTPRFLCDKILQLFSTFYTKISQLRDSKTCECGACGHIEDLELKVVAHYGNAEITELGQFKELSGTDIIIPHRLLKNSIPKKCYFLMTEAAFNQLNWPPDKEVSQQNEKVQDFGDMTIFVHYPPSLRKEARELPMFVKKLKKAKILLIQAPAQIMMKLGLKKPPVFHNIHPPGSEETT